MSGDALLTMNRRPVDTDAADRALWEVAMNGIGLPLSVHAAAADQPPSAANLRRTSLDSIALVNMACRQMRAARTRREASSSSHRHVAALVVRAGNEFVRDHVDDASMLPGDLIMWDVTHPAEFIVQSYVRKVVLLIPEDEFRIACGGSDPIAGLRLIHRSPATILLANYLTALGRTAHDLRPASANSARVAALELLAGAVRAEPAIPVSETYPALRTAIESWVDRQLGRGPITAASAAATHAVSVRTVHRAFAANNDSFGSMVRRRRLQHARRDLELTEHQISVIAAHWGFSDASHFARSFKSQFGVSPSDYRHCLH
ncbi:helix-turn-helix domain-containing protein (plasmid) [Gordonia polyisoprenivorans]|uniref:helix-turn-helix domain-containing protein n=1 Tax=Gordonia polyisoprenivorans TaxID=84595 RepID=UPI00223409FF|nr:helix-turn-helix domain-containing protein [uncultured Gordonia sp.]UZF59329.1 helix-turn-helix domain-containing protein [Gordonia polyisoprenivorans]